MPTYSFTRTLPEIVGIVLRKLGALGIDETASAEDKAVVREAVDLRLKELHALGVLWFNVSGAATDLALTSGTATASLSAITDFLFPVSVKLRVGSDDQGVDIISHREYQAIENKTDRGEPSKVFVSGGTAYFWPVPDANYTAKLTYQAAAEDTTAAGAPDVPASWMRSLAAVVAGDLVDDFDVPEPKASRLMAAQRDALKTIRILNTEPVDSVPVSMSAY